jgi:hypothetical protein
MRQRNLRPFPIGKTSLRRASRLAFEKPPTVGQSVVFSRLRFHNRRGEHRYGNQDNWGWATHLNF